MKSVSILRGRDRMCDVLEAHLDFELARERANNIAQVLAILPEAPYDIALAMLSRAGISDVAAVAAKVSDAWHAGVSEMERVA